MVLALWATSLNFNLHAIFHQLVALTYSYYVKVHNFQLIQLSDNFLDLLVLFLGVALSSSHTDYVMRVGRLRAFHERMDLYLM